MKNIPSHMRLVCCVAALTILLFAGGAVAQIYVEDFTTSTYRNGVTTSANWDEAGGQLTLRPFAAELAGSVALLAQPGAVEVSGHYAFVAQLGQNVRIHTEIMRTGTRSTARTRRCAAGPQAIRTTYLDTVTSINGIRSIADWRGSGAAAAAA